MRRHQRGVSLAVVILVLAILVAVLLTLRSVTRTTDRDTDRQATFDKMDRIQAALEEFAALNRRLPCPADPTSASDGTEKVGALAGTCGAILGTSLGTVPWANLGLRPDDIVDAWGVRFSYATYTGSGGPLGIGNGFGSVTLLGGVDMTNCDDAKAGGPDVSGLCKVDHSTGSAVFLDANKGLKVHEVGGAPHNDVAYVVISHGPTGMGGFLVNGTQRAMPQNNDEKKNATPSNDFYIDPFSTSDTNFNTSSFFDDFVRYRSLTDLVQRIGLVARVWPIQGQVAVATFNQQTMNATGVGSLGPGVQTVNVNGVVAGTLTAGATLGLGSLTLSDGTTAQGVGIAGGGNAILSSTSSGVTNGVFGLQFPADVRYIGMSLAGFDKSIFLVENLRLDFYDASLSPVGSATESACHLTQTYSTYSVKAPANFRFVQISAQPATPVLIGANGPTAFLLSQVIACDNSASTCPPPMNNAKYVCP